jgi:hypothetical protein
LVLAPEESWTTSPDYYWWARLLPDKSIDVTAAYRPEDGMAEVNEI